VQDGFELYLHGFFASVDGDWCVVQQGMNPMLREARRYHWLSDNITGFFDSPHAAIEGRNVGSIINLADHRADANRLAGLDLVRTGPDLMIAALRDVGGHRPRNLDLFSDHGTPVVRAAVPIVDEHWQQHRQETTLQLPVRHDLREADVDLKRLHATLTAAADQGPKDFSDLLLTPGVGARTVASLAFVAEIIHGAPYRFTDPARFALAHGGKDGHPFPVPLKVYDETVSVLKRAIGNAKLGRREELDAIKRLDDQARRIEYIANGPSFAQYIGAERERSRGFGGRTGRSQTS
jgi:hypothetical protein